jgi:hypothetical protein
MDEDKSRRDLLMREFELVDEEKFTCDLLMRKFEPVSDWRPAGEKSDITQTVKSVFNETLEHAQKHKEALEQALGPLAEEAWAQIKGLAGVLEGATTKSSKEARALLAKTFNAMAERIKP